jgi:hypothetical protein
MERWIRWAWAKVALVGVLAATGAALAPLAVPVMDPEPTRAYAASLGIQRAPDEKYDSGPLPQHFADQFGWAALATQVAGVFHALPPEEQRVAAIYAGNYGEAGAIDFFGPRLGLPRASSGHNSYFLWGPPGEGRGAVMIVIGAGRARLEEVFESVTEAGETDQPYAMPFEDHLAIWVCRGPKQELAALWPETKRYL